MEYMEQQMQQQIEAGMDREKRLGFEFTEFTQWFIGLQDVDDTLVDRKYLDARYDLNSPSDTANALLAGWRAKARV